MDQQGFGKFKKDNKFIVVDKQEVGKNNYFTTIMLLATITKLVLYNQMAMKIDKKRQNLANRTTTINKLVFSK